MTALHVVAPGGASTLQDLGRPGYGRFGVPEAGAMDRLALRLANRIVGNADTEACVEFAMMGGTYAAPDGGCRIADCLLGRQGCRGIWRRRSRRHFNSGGGLRRRGRRRVVTVRHSGLINPFV